MDFKGRSIDTFMAECDELLGEIEEIALALEHDRSEPEVINRLFRAFHNMKGSGAMFGFDAVAAFTHHVETMLDKVRTGALEVSDPLIDVVLASKDHIQALLQATLSQAELPGAHEAELVARLRAFTPASRTELVTEAPLRTYHIDFRPRAGASLAPDAIETLLEDLRALGPCAVSHTPASDGGPMWKVVLDTRATADPVHDAFIFLHADLELAIEDHAPASVEVAGFELFDDPVPVPAPAAPAAVAVTETPVVAVKKRADAPDTVVRVASDKLDRLVNLVGELVISQSRLQQVASRIRDPELGGPVEEIERLVAELRDGVLGVRMTQIGGTFGRFKRLVHDLSSQLGKEVELVTEGAATELDKTVLDKLGDPLMHLVRNAIDHGIEDTATRVARGKPARGHVRVAAMQAGQSVVITIGDDGRGLDAVAIQKKAVERELIAPDTQMELSDVYNLIMLPGLSTAQTVTDISGRGVGMDVVKKQIESLRGSVSISSEPGRGTTFSLTLPLTLAIIDGLLVEVGGDRFIIPLAAVTETVELPRGDRQRHNGRCAVVVRDDLVPYIGLREIFAVTTEAPPNEKVIIVKQGDHRIGLAVDRVLGGHQTVIQPIGRLYRDVEIVSGATIMGDGRVALILDLAGIVRLWSRQGRAQNAVANTAEALSH